jgi:hypothetical protein
MRRKVNRQFAANAKQIVAEFSGAMKKFRREKNSGHCSAARRILFLEHEFIAIRESARATAASICAARN